MNQLNQRMNQNQQLIRLQRLCTGSCSITVQRRATMQLKPMRVNGAIMATRGHLLRSARLSAVAAARSCFSLALRGASLYGTCGAAGTPALNQSMRLP